MAERLGDYLSQLIGRSNLRCGDDTLEDLVLDVLIDLLNVLHSFMKCEVACSKGDSLVVTLYRRRCLRDNT